MSRAALVSLTRDDLIALMLEQHARIEAQAQRISMLTARIAELEAKLAAPPKAPDNSSLPSSKGHKPNLPERGKSKPRPSRRGVTRALAEHPNRIVEATLAACPHRDHALGPADMTASHAYDRIDLPPIHPIITRVNRHRGVCPCCRKHVSAPAPEGFEPGSPFGPGVDALILHPHITQAIGFERLRGLMGEVFGLSISEGAIANILARVQTPLLAAADTRAASVVTEFPQGLEPGIWVADRYGGQLGHGAGRRMCLAHSPRDARYAIRLDRTAGAEGGAVGCIGHDAVGATPADRSA